MSVLASPPDADGKMYGVVRKDKKGRARLEPLDMAADIESRLLRLKAG